MRGIGRHGDSLVGTLAGLWLSLALACGGAPDASSDGENGSSGDADSSSHDASADATSSGSSASGGLTSGSEGTTDSTSDTPTTGTSGESSDESGDETGGQMASVQLLFVGNSYVFFNDLPTLVEGVAEGLGEVWAVDSHAAGGAMFGDHLQNPAVTDALASGDYEFVVLQGQSVEPIHPALSMAAAQNALALADLVIQGDGEPVFFETWARAPGHEDYAQPWTGGGPGAMQMLLHDAYAGYATDSGGTLGPVGQAWIDLLIDGVDIELYDGDGAHPSVAGSYLAACVFYAVVSGESPEGATGWPEAISEDDALILQTTAAAAVF